MPPAAPITPKTGHPTDAWAASLLAALAITLYGTTLCPTVYWYDSAEYATAGAVFGIPHPPGYPLYSIVAGIFARLLPTEPAYAVNMLSAVGSALAVALAFTVQRRLGASTTASAVGAVTLTTAPLLWDNAVIAEVYGPGLAGCLAVLHLLLQALDQRSFHRVLWTAGLAGLLLGVHLSLATLGLGFALLAWATLDAEQPGLPLREQARRLATAAGATLAGSAIFLYLPLRASMNPPLNIGHANVGNQLLWIVTGGNFKHLFEAPESSLHRSATILEVLAEQLGLVAVPFAIFGLVSLTRIRRRIAAALGLSIVGNLAFFFCYQVDDYEMFLLPSAAVATCCVGPGVDAAARQLTGLAKRIPWRAGIAGALIVASAWRATSDYAVHDKSDERSAERYGQMLTDRLPPGAVLVDFSLPDEWKYKAVFGYYFRLVLGVRPDITTVTKPPLDTLALLVKSPRPVFLYGANERIARHFDLEREGAVYRVRLRRANAEDH